MKSPEQHAFDTITDIHDKSERIAPTIATEWQREAFERLTSTLVAQELAKVAELDEQPTPEELPTTKKTKFSGATFNPFGKAA